MDLLACAYLLLNIILIISGSVIYPNFIFNKACKMGLTPPVPFSFFRTQSIEFWIYIDKKSKIKEFGELRKYISIPKYLGLVNAIIGIFFLVYYWDTIQNVSYQYFNERWLFN
jgi:hypothetical protein